MSDESVAHVLAGATLQVSVGRQMEESSACLTVLVTVPVTGVEVMSKAWL